MPQVINTNVSSIGAQSQLNRTNSGLTEALNRLSSGKRINNAKDDAAGIAIASRFTSQIRGYNQGIRNAADAVSLTQTAEGALDEISNNLQRIRELAVQAANATNSSVDRAALNTEVSQLKLEIARVTNTQFNGVTVIGGNAGSFAFQVGPNNNASVDQVKVTTQNTTTLSGYTEVVTNGGVGTTDAATSMICLSFPSDWSVYVLPKILTFKV